MKFPICELPAAGFTAHPGEIPQPPDTLNYRGTLPSPDTTLLAVVGSRRYSAYGKAVVDHLIGGLSGYPVGIVSGMALGIDGLAHEAALANNLYTLAIPGGGLADEALYPAKHRRLAQRILEAGGGLLSEFTPEFRATKWSFPQRNRLVCGMAPATLLIEAAEQSGTLITARMTVDYNRELLVVPGDIFAKNTKGVHQFLKYGATPVTEPADILRALSVDVLLPTTDAAATTRALSPEETLMLSLLTEATEKDALIRASGLPPAAANVLLMQMEIAGLVVCENNYYRPLVSVT